MRKALLLAAASVMVLSACEGREGYDRTDESVNVELIEPMPTFTPVPDPTSAAPTPPKLQVRSTPPPTVARAESLETRAAPALQVVRGAELGQTDQPRIAPLAPVAKIAYAFSYVMSAPRDRGAELMSRHEFACASAGPGLCQVVSGNADWTSRQPGGRLELRGQPEWINRFRATLAADARNAGGRLERTNTEGVDVTRGIDAAATNAQTTATIADRIKELQRQKGGSLQEQLRIERQLAELQRLQDDQQLELRDMNDRVQSARLTIDYRQAGVMAADSSTRPVAVALQNAFGLAMIVVAGLITLGSILLPIGAVAGAAWWVARRRRKPMAVAA